MSNIPLAHRLRPNSIDELIGQEHLIGKGMVIKNMIDNNRLLSMIFYGPPGSGKTTLAILLSKHLNYKFKFFNATINNKQDLQSIFELTKYEDNIVLIIDEVHRLNKDKQDLLLPYIERGKIILIGATTANPYFSINPAIRSRLLIFEFKQLQDHHIKIAIEKAINNPSAFNKKLTISKEATNYLIKISNGDIRYLYNLLEVISFGIKDNHIDVDIINTYASIANNAIDANDEGHYNLLSAFQKSIRGSDVDASLYYLAQLCIAQDMTSIERRLLVIAYEDIGLGNPAAVSRTINAIESAKRVGFPEAIIPLGLQVIDLALSPKSKTASNAISSAIQIAKTNPYNPPKYLNYTPYGLKEEEKYSYEKSNLWNYIQYLPDKLKNISFLNLENNSQYESQLLINYQKLKKIKRTNDIVKLNTNK